LNDDRQDGGRSGDEREESQGSIEK